MRGVMLRAFILYVSVIFAIRNKVINYVDGNNKKVALFFV